MDLDQSEMSGPDSYLFMHDVLHSVVFNAALPNTKRSYLSPRPKLDVRFLLLLIKPQQYTTCNFCIPQICK
uniref:Uncharacterized protein n=1 Tax=Hyaloperonospora arabidopsidis (strain Emoy2) TaxID=559515 RepID=M4BTD6_HYAAE